MFRFLFRKDWKKSPPHLLLLSKFLRGADPESFEDREYWKPALKESPRKAIKRFLEEGMLEPAALQELVDYKFKVSDLKSILKQGSLKVSGRKSELIDRLIAADENGMRKATKNISLLKCSERARAVAKGYLVREKEKRSQTENKVLVALRVRDFDKACSTVVKYEAKQIFPRGLGIDWNNYDCRRDIAALKTIFNQRPAILKGINEECLDQLRIAAGMMHLWGTGSAKAWLPDNIQTGIHIDAESATRMFVFHASHQRNMQEYRDVGAKSIEILGAGDSVTCSACRKIAGKKYKLRRVPELPYEKCKSAIGCRCTTVVADY